MNSSQTKTMYSQVVIWNWLYQVFNKKILFFLILKNNPTHQTLNLEQEELIYKNSKTINLKINQRKCYQAVQ